MKTYLSGGMSNLPEFNFPAFHRAAASLRARGIEVVNPAELDAADTEPKTWAEYLRRDIKALMDCDCIAMLPGWRDSKGATLENHIAQQLGMQVIELPQEQP